MWKNLSQPYAIHNAVQAVQMASRGITGPAKVFEGVPGGVFDSIAGSQVPADWIEDSDCRKITETAIKPYCSGYGAIPAVEATTKILSSHDLTVSDVESIEVRVVDRLLETYGSEEKWGPDLSRETADHSIPYCVAIALHTGTVYPEHYQDDWLRNPSVSDVMNRITITGSDELTAYEHAHPRELPTEVRITTKHNTYTERVSTPPGHPENPFTHAQLHEKFATITDSSLTGAEQNDIIAACDSLARQESVESLLEHLQ
jgi:2-methylcitrate dehydratase